MTTAPTTGKLAAVNLKDAGVVGIGAVLLLASLLGLTWLVMPANPATDAPAAAVSFNDLTAATKSSPSTVQSTYFGWLAWVLFGAIILLSVAVLLTGNRLIAAVTAGIGLLTAILTTLALKGPQTWSQTIEALPNLRIGGYLMLIGLLALLIFNAIKARPQRVRNSTTITTVKSETGQAPSKA